MQIKISDGGVDGRQEERREVRREGRRGGERERVERKGGTEVGGRGVEGTTRHYLRHYVEPRTPRRGFLKTSPEEELSGVRRTMDVSPPESQVGPEDGPSWDRSRWKP